MTESNTINITETIKELLKKGDQQALFHEIDSLSF